MCEPPCPRSVSVTAGECTEFKHLMQGAHPSTMERTYEAPSNEAPHMLLGYHQGRLVTVGKVVQSWFVFMVVHVDEDLKPSSFCDFNEEDTQLST